MGRTGLNRKTALATLTLTLAAEAPDLDTIGRFWGPAVGFAHHRGFTHSFLGVPLDAAVVVAFVYLVWRLRGRKTKDPELSLRWGVLFFYACLGGLSHILLDFTNNYGVRPFWPFSEKWYSWDIVFVVEPVMLVLLILGLVVPSVFSLIDKELGARSRGPRGRVAATLALMGVVLMWGLRDYEHRVAVNALEARTYNGVDPLRASAYPTMTDPIHWYGVIETPAFLRCLPWMLLDLRLIQKNEWVFVTNLRRPRSRSRRKNPMLAGRFWIGPSIRSRRQKCLSLPKRALLCIFRICATRSFRTCSVGIEGAVHCAWE